MDLRDTPEEATFRAELRAWIDENLTDEIRRGRFEEAGRDWSRKLHEAGYAGLTWPKEYGGAGAPYSHQAIFLEEMARAEAPPHLGVIGLGMAGPTIIAHGTDAQKQKHLEKILSTEEIWCQGFSEPDAGSDLSAVRTTARRENGHFVVDGQKVWSSFAHIADYCILVTRSDPESERHAGLTYLLVDMHSPGVEVRPLRQITGEAEFNEIFFTGVEVPEENVVGEIGGGWQVAMTTLLHERGTLGFALTAGLEAQIQKLIALAERAGRDAGAARRDRAGVDRPPGRPLHELPLADDADEDRDPRPGGLRRQALVVGGEPAGDEARARVARPRGADRRERRLLAAPAAPLPRQHDRGRHLRDPAQHHRRACARPPEEPLVEFAFTQEQEELRRQARSFLEANPDAPLAELRELGWLGVSVPEERGGGGLSFVDEAILFEEAGRALYAGPFLTTAVVLPALPEVDDNAWSVEVDGLVPHLDTADMVLREDLSTVAADGETLATVDESRPLGRLDAADAIEVDDEFEPVRLRLLAALAAEAVGVAQKALELGVAYVSDREQFGKKIGTYQAVSHPLADTYVETELARSLAYWAAWCVAEEDERTPVAVASAKSFAAETAVAACERAIQVHGGIGFTWEHVLHRYYKRAQWIDAFGGHAAKQREVVAAALLDEARRPVARSES